MDNSLKSFESSSSNAFSSEQVNFLCNVLCSWRDGKRLKNFFSSWPMLMQLVNAQKSTVVLKAYAFCLFHQQKYDQLFKTLEGNHFSETINLKEDHGELRELWYEARYAENEDRKCKKLGPVDKYRIRKKFRPPPSVWDGEEIVYSFKAPSRMFLREFYIQNKYPNSDQKKDISRSTGLSMIQISNWFKNRRQRDKTKGR